MKNRTLPALVLTTAGFALAWTHVAADPEPAKEVAVAPEKEELPPMRVRWRQDLSKAKAEAKAKGRPLLLFQLLGNLDQEFC